MKERGREGENMVGMTTGEAMRVADRNAAGCLVASAGALALLAVLAGWLVYLACGRWTALERALPPLGLVALGVALQMTWSHWRKGA